jgi:ferredoxin
VAHIEADLAVCAGSGLCAYIAARYFDASGGVVHVLRTEVDAGDEADVEEAVGACPTQALRLRTAPGDGG